MALTRRTILGSVPFFLGLAVGCAASTNEIAAFTGLREITRSGTGSSQLPTILVLMPDTPQTREVWKGLTDELSEGYCVIAVRIDHSSESIAVGEAIRVYQPSALVLMNNPTLKAYKAYQASGKASKFPPAVVVMTSFLEGQVQGVTNATGINYEIPLITVITNLRRLLKLGSERVGVVVREPLAAFVSKEVQLARREKIKVVTEFVSADANASEIKRAIRRLKGEADVVWILNDDRLLSPRLISEAWLPGLEERPWVPTIVGAGSLVLAERALGTFAVLPDHVGLGAQAASVLLDMADNGWTLDAGASVQMPLSTTTTMDLGQVKERFVMRDGAMQQVDRVVE